MVGYRFRRLQFVQLEGLWTGVMSWKQSDDKGLTALIVTVAPGRLPPLLIMALGYGRIGVPD